MEITNATFTVPSPEAGSIWQVRLTVEGGEFVRQAAPVVAAVGTVQVEGIVLKIMGDGFVGLLRTVPQIGDVLKIGYLDGELVDTPFTFTGLPLV